MNKILFALAIIGVEKTEYLLCSIFLDLLKNEQYGEIPGRNLRQLLNLTKDTLFSLLEGLSNRHIFSYSQTVMPPNSIYVKAGAGQYIFNMHYQDWEPVETSLFYTLCRLEGYRFNADSWNIILEKYDIRKEGTRKNLVEKKLTPYQLYNDFCEEYQQLFHKEYKPLHIERDLAYCKKIICDCSFKNLKDPQILEFLEWAFRVKVKDFKGEFLVGFLPLCLRDYLASTLIQVVRSGYIKDENGNLIKDETQKS